MTFRGVVIADERHAEDGVEAQAGGDGLSLLHAAQSITSSSRHLRGDDEEEGGVGEVWCVHSSPSQPHGTQSVQAHLRHEYDHIEGYG